MCGYMGKCIRGQLVQVCWSPSVQDISAVLRVTAVVVEAR